ncbi:ABC transporter permease subunit [Sporichthya polymorpha]|uniref:ABC transporter permease subunit n=1 Tax=Sporichthya polymorpha TaxID=35751 RepID=UPI0003772D7F|nr:Gldg family protein [Sporichthya polymorpha]
MLTLLKRELTSLLLWPARYLIAAAYIVISGILFIDLVSSNNSADLESYYANTVNTLLVMCPILAARAIAEERASGALQISLAWPVPRWAMVLSKFVANTLITWLVVSISWIYYVRLDSIAEPEFARVLGGWIGLLLLSAMFNAISLAISSRMNTSVGAAFLAFVVLLVLRLIEFLPDNLEGKVDQFSPLTRLNPLLDGVLPAEDVAYFVVLAAAALAIAVYSLGRRRAGSNRPVMVQRVAAFIGVTAFVVGAPSVAGAASGEIDLTPGDRETVSAATQEIIDKLGKTPITLTAFSPSLSLQASQARATVRKYEAAGAKIELKVIDPDISPALARASGVIDYNDYLLTVGGKSREIDDLVESALTAAITQLGETDPPLACFIQGHDERRINDVQDEGLTSFAARLRIIGWRTSEVFLSGTDAPQLLRQCEVVLVIGPGSRIPIKELQILQDYTRKQGRLVVAADPVRGDIGQLNQLVTPWGLKFLPEPLRDPQSVAGDSAAIISSRYPSASSVVDTLNKDDTPVLFSNTLAIDKAGPDGDEGPQVAPLVQSSPKSYRVDKTGKLIPQTEGVHTLAGFTYIPEREAPGETPRLTSTRVGVLGTANAASNLYQKSFGNQDLVVRLTQFIAGEDVIISAYREVGQNAQFQITGAPTHLVDPADRRAADARCARVRAVRVLPAEARVRAQSRPPSASPSCSFGFQGRDGG